MFKGLKSIFLIPSNRNSYKKNICIDMLRQGYHKSFSELFALIEKWNALREAAGPGSAIWQQKSLGEQPDKLDQLYHFLTRAEAAQRAGIGGIVGSRAAGAAAANAWGKLPNCFMYEFETLLHLSTFQP